VIPIPISNTSTDLTLRFSLFWDVTLRRLVITDVSGQPISHIFNGQAVCFYNKL